MRRKLSALRRRELAQDARQRQPRGYQGIGPRAGLECPSRLQRERDRQSMLVAYAVALAQKRGQLGTGLHDLNEVSALVVDFGNGTAIVKFYRLVEVRGRHGVEYRAAELPFLSVDLRHLNWVPADPIEEVLGDDDDLPCAA